MGIAEAMVSVDVKHQLNKRNRRSPVEVVVWTDRCRCQAKPSQAKPGSLDLSAPNSESQKDI
jgi:hypothetical protein